MGAVNTTTAVLSSSSSSSRVFVLTRRIWCNQLNDRSITILVVVYLYHKNERQQKEVSWYTTKKFVVYKKKAWCRKHIDRSTNISSSSSCICCIPRRSSWYTTKTAWCRKHNDCSIIIPSSLSCIYSLYTTKKFLV